MTLDPPFGQKAYIVLRDGEFHSAYPMRVLAEGWRRKFAPGSKHKWTVVRGRVIGEGRDKGERIMPGPKGKCVEWLREHVAHEGDECLIWPFARNPEKGYGTLGYLGHIHYAHRFMCALVHGPAPKGKPQATHSCAQA